MKTFIKIRIVFLLLFVVWFQFGIAQNIDKPALDSYIEDLEAQHLFNGSVAISQAGKLVYSKSVGIIDFENKKKVDENSHFRIGSITKTFTAVLVMKAIEQGKLKLDQTIEQFFPDIPYADKISIELLLRHRSGLFKPTKNPDLMKLRNETLTREDILTIAKTKKSEFEPDAKTQYNNVNYILLTFILENVYKMSFDDVLKKYIVEPLGLKNTFYEEKTADLNNEIKSYRYRGKWKLLPKTDASVVLGAGAMISTAVDLVKFSDALFHGKLVSNKDLELMKDFKKRYGLGLTYRAFPDDIGLGHAGGIDGHKSIFLYFEDQDVSYAVVSNSNVKVDEISQERWNILFGIYSTGNEKSKVFSNDLEKYEGNYFSKEMDAVIMVEARKNKLVAHIKGQSSYELTPIKENHFTISSINARVVFDRQKNQAILKQGENRIVFTKE